MNQLSQQELWEKIQNFQLDEPASAFPFSKKLAKENNWSVVFTNKAIAEYKKFIYLCCISPTGASPSETVDKVWHLHLTYTDSYWNKFCKNILNKEIHHHPSKGGSNEKHKHDNWHRDTLKLYEATFSTKAPLDIWPVSEPIAEEIAEDIYDTAYFKKLVFIFTFSLVVFILTLNPFGAKGEDFLNYYLLICIGGIITLFITQRHKDERLQLIIENNYPKKFTPFQMARFLYGNHRCYQTALVDLLRKGIIATKGNDYKIVNHQAHIADGEQNPLLQPLMKNLNEGDTFSYREGHGFIETDTVLHSDLEKLYRLSKKIDYPKLIIPSMVLLIGFARFLQGIANDKPVGLLVFEIGAFSILSLIILQSYSYTKTIKQQLGLNWQQQNSDGYGNDIINNFTILGTTAIISFAEYGLLTNVFNSVTMAERKLASSGSAGCGSGTSGGCSSGGDGGGGSCGGGCGGCGGD